jgi:hypothetical protein
MVRTGWPAGERSAPSSPCSTASLGLNNEHNISKQFIKELTDNVEVVPTSQIYLRGREIRYSNHTYFFMERKLGEWRRINVMN